MLIEYCKAVLGIVLIAISFIIAYGLIGHLLAQIMIEELEEIRKGRKK